MTRTDFINLRNLYKPSKIKCIFIAESPPSENKRYFYHPQGPIYEPLFQNLLDITLNKNFITKIEGLDAFKQGGFWVLDAVYSPIDKLPERTANHIIEKQYKNLVKDLKYYKARTVPLLLIKANICKSYGSRLLAEGYKILNPFTPIPFPSWFHKKTFHKLTKTILINNNIIST